MMVDESFEDCRHVPRRRLCVTWSRVIRTDNYPRLWLPGAPHWRFPVIGLELRMYPGVEKAHPPDKL